MWNELLVGLGLNLSVKNPYWNKTKGEMAGECKNKDVLYETMKLSFSCSSPGKARWKQLSQQHCGYCVPSVNWRSLYLDILDFVENSVVGIDALECLIESEKIMNEFLRGKRNDLGKIENHIFFFDDIKELSVGASNFADLKPHATFHRGIGSYTFCYEDEKTYGTLTNMMGVILVTLYHKGQREVWNNTEILNGVGRIEAKDQQIQSVFGNELIHIMETAKKASEAMSVAQQKKAEDRIKAAGEDVKNYSVFQDWMNDMDLKNRITDK